MTAETQLRLSVVPAKAGTQDREEWIPAFAGMTANGGVPTCFLVAREPLADR